MFSPVVLSSCLLNGTLPLAPPPAEYLYDTVVKIGRDSDGVPDLEAILGRLTNEVSDPNSPLANHQHEILGATAALALCSFSLRDARSYAHFTVTRQFDCDGAEDLRKVSTWEFPLELQIRPELAVSGSTLTITALIPDEISHHNLSLGVTGQLEISRPNGNEPITMGEQFSTCITAPSQVVREILIAQSTLQPGDRVSIQASIDINGLQVNRLFIWEVKERGLSWVTSSDPNTALMAQRLSEAWQVVKDEAAAKTNDLSPSTNEGTSIIPIERSPALYPIKLHAKSPSAPHLSPSISVAADGTLELHSPLQVLHFWTTWCMPCRREMPTLDLLQEEFPSIPIISVCDSFRNKDFAGIEEWLGEGRHPVIIASPESVHGNAIDLYPTYLVVDSDGCVRLRKEGGSFPKEELLQILSTLDR